MNRKLVVFAAVATAALGMVAHAEEKPKVAFITQSLENDSQAFAWKTMQAHADEYGFDVQVFEEDYDSQNGVAAIEQCIAQGYTAIAINPTDASALVPSMKEAMAEGVIVSLYSTELPDELANTDSRTFMCGSNDVLGGQIAAETLMAQFPDGVKVVEVGGQSGHAAQLLRHDGFFNTIDDSVEVLDSKDCAEWSTDDAQAIMEDFITLYGDEIEAVFCHWDNGATGVINALQDAGIEGVYVIGVDGNQTGYQQVKDGTQGLCVGQNFDKMTTDTFDCITAFLNGEEDSVEWDTDQRNLWTDMDVVTVETIDDFPWPEW